MGITITERPDKEVSAGYDSRWLAVNGGYPVYFTLFRKDYSLVSVSDDGQGFSKLTVTGDITAELTAGDAVFFYSASMGSYSAIITSYSYSTNTEIITDEPFTLGATDSDASNYLNLLGGRADYKMVIQVMGTDSNELLFEGKFGPTAAGEVNFDIAGAITPQINADISETYPTLVQQDTNTTQPFYIRFGEFYNATAFNTSADTAFYYAVNTANQIRDTYGENLGDRVAFNADITPKARWLSAFESPVFWPNYPFSLTTIVETNGTEPGISRYEERFDSAGTSIGTNTYPWGTQDFSYPQINGTLLDSYPTSICEVDIWLESDLAGDPCTTLAGLTQAQKWNFQQVQYDPVTLELLAFYIEANPISGISSIDTHPDVTITDGSSSWLYQWNATQGYYEPVSGPNYLIQGQSYTATIASINVTRYGQSCTTSFAQSFVVGTRSSDAPEATNLQILLDSGDTFKTGADVYCTYFYQDPNGDPLSKPSTLFELWAFDNNDPASTGTKIADLSHILGLGTGQGTKTSDPETIPASAENKYLALKVQPYSTVAPVQGDLEIYILPQKIVKDETALVLPTDNNDPLPFEFSLQVAAGVPYYLVFSDGEASEYYEGTGAMVIHDHTFFTVATPQTVTVCCDATQVQSLSASSQGINGTIDFSLCTGWNGYIDLSGNPNLTGVTAPTSGTPVVTSLLFNSTGLTAFDMGYWRGNGTGNLYLYSCASLASFTQTTDAGVTDVQYNQLWIYNCSSLSGTLNASKFQSCENFRFQNDTLVTAFTGPSTSSVAIRRFQASASGLTGTIDLSGFTSGMWNQIYLDNIAITGITWPAKSAFDTLASGGSYFTVFRIFSTNLTGAHSLANVTNLGGEVLMRNNSLLTSLTFATSNYSGTFTSVTVDSCGFTSALDFSKMVNFSTTGVIDYAGNTSLPSVNMPVLSAGAIQTLDGTNTGASTYANHDTTDLTLSTSGISIDLTSNGMSATEVDNALVDLDSKLSAGSGTIDVSSNTAPTGTGTAAATSLAGKGYTVITD